MKITTKGQVNTPQRPRLKFGLLARAEVAFAEPDPSEMIRPALCKEALIEKRLRELRGVAGDRTTTDDVMRLTRGDE